MIVASLVALVLVRPVEVLEQRTLLTDAPLSEVVVVRARYRPRGRLGAELPAGVQGSLRPIAFAPGEQGTLAVQRDERGTWWVAMPDRETDTVRIVARTVRPVRDGVLFSLDWPRVVATDVPTRYVLEVPRSMLRDTPPGWTCPDDGYPHAQCVSGRRRPDALRLRIPALRGAWWHWALAACAVSAAAMIARVVSRPEHARAHAVGAAGGAVAGACVMLALVGAHWTGWALAVAVAVSPGLVAGALAARSRPSSVVGAVALLTIASALGAGWRAVPITVTGAVVFVVIAVVGVVADRVLRGQNRASSV